ncbi:MAG: 1-acyl-sn-glycerol-3-phosphate acyltransferase [Anaerolineae bacterium]|nr:1-acyl-sn-glycerol-3-phosphate acyltransferase [Anaerolineae bacterium]
MNTVRGLIRLGACLLVLMVGAPLVMGAALIPLRPRGAKLGNWIVVIGARLILRALAIRLVAKNQERLKQHRGFIFPNHHSALDVVILAAIHPIRFLSKAEIRPLPFIGWIAVAIETVFVQREDKQSRLEARNVLLDTPRYPPIALFPEGAIIPNGPLLSPFRYGAFAIAQQTQTPYIPGVFRYEQRELVHWGDESLLATLWRIASRPAGSLTVELLFLHPIHPRPDDDPELLALEAHGAILAVLQRDTVKQVVMEEGV